MNPVLNRKNPGMPRLEAAFVWADNPAAFFDPARPKDEPQCFYRYTSDGDRMGKTEKRFYGLVLQPV